MALFSFLDTNSIQHEISRLCTETQNHEENARGGMDCRVQNGQEKKN